MPTSPTAKPSSGFKRIAKFDQVAVPIFAEVLGHHSGESMFSLDVTNVGHSLLDRVLDKAPWSCGLDSRAVGPGMGDAKS